jgi:hypothetical protein
VAMGGKLVTLKSQAGEAPNGEALSLVLALPAKARFPLSAVKLWSNLVKLGLLLPLISAAVPPWCRMMSAGELWGS